ncbi:hypothetical protein E4T42_00118 [Aureobasidium subglaciale]|nr:hypothetical protein E4T40_02253 [Aureobasidium subglaciale]KAI5259586.1 hypothetical protein E4T42_00118 [Aureobasidium subglaciale]KAI5265555.1 hypothetical protein E4T46_02251 [Aureobasidium subglaciale]
MCRKALCLFLVDGRGRQRGALRAGYAEALVAAMSGVLPMTYLYGFPQLPSSTASCALRFLLGEVAWK